MRKKAALFVVLSVPGLFFGCSPDRGPVGPAGMAGPGVQTIHTLTVAPEAPDSSREITAPEIKVDPGCDCSSTVLCYAVFSSDGSETPIPTTRVEPDGTTTVYQVEVRTGKVTILWKNSAATIPSVSQFVVTVLNQK